MSSIMKMLSPTRAQLEITVSAEEIEKSEGRVLSVLAKKVRLKGFRHGKAPKRIVKQMMGKEVLNDVRNDIVPRFLFTAVKEHEITPVSEPEVDAGEIKEKEPFSFKVSVDVAPRLDKIDFDGI